MRWRLVVGISVLALGVGGCVPPISVVPPMVVGTPQVGVALTVTQGVWLLPGTYTYQWQRCEADGSGCVDVAGAESNTYTAVAADEGRRLRARVRNTNAYGSRDAWSAPSGVVAPAPPSGPSTARVSVATDGTQGNAYSWGGWRSLSADGRYVAFESGASNLVAGDTNDRPDTFVHDRQSGETTRVSVATDGTQGDGPSYGFQPSLSADGRYVVFGSLASNLVAGDTNVAGDVFVHDRESGETTRVSVATDGTQSDAWSWGGSLSADGRYVAFVSLASNLVAEDTNGTYDVFVHDRESGETTRVSVATDGTQSDAYSGSSEGSLSADGRYVVFGSGASNLVAGDTNGARDVFVHDRESGETTRVSVATDGTQSDAYSGSSEGSLSADGRYVVFGSGASNLVAGDTNGARDVFVHDRESGETTRVSLATDGTQGDGDSYEGSLSADGRYVAFMSDGSNLVAGDTNGHTDIFVHDRESGETTRVSVATDGTQSDAWSWGGSLSADGRYVAFVSLASNLVAGDTIDSVDVFVHDRG